MNKKLGPVEARLKKRKRFQYVLIAILFHILLLLIIGPILIVAPFTREVLFKARIETRPKASLKKNIRPTKTKVIKEVPVHLIRKALKVKKRILVKKTMKTPTFMRPPLTLAPKDIPLPKKQVERSQRILFRERAQRRQTYRQFSRQFKISGIGKEVKAVFTPVLARYRGGDWDKDPTALPNLMREINRRSNIKANETPKIVSVDSPEIFKCPFVYFTGTKNFSLTEAEVKNLRKYLLQGGLVWADNGLPGRRSRFDVAFRREMKRVLPDRDFETIPLSNKIFSSFYNLRKVPSAMNYRNDPLEMVKIDRRVVIIYTLNDYTDFWETRFDSDGNVDGSWDRSWKYRYWGPYWLRRGDLYENLSQKTVDNAYRLGLNIVAYLLTR